MKAPNKKKLATWKSVKIIFTDLNANNACRDKSVDS